MSTQHTPESLAAMPVVTVEQIARFREAALRVEQQRNDLQLEAETERNSAIAWEESSKNNKLKCDELLADAMRYRYLRDTNATRFDGDLDSAPAGIVDTIFITEGYGCSSGADPDELDAAIDAAIAKAQGVQS